MNLDFIDKTVVVTGGTTGIGAAIAEEFYKAGANLIVTGIDSPEKMKELARTYSNFRLGMIRFINVDFTSEESLSRFFKELDKYQEIDICINNAGTNRNNYIEDISLEDYHLLIAVNLHAPFLITQYLAPRMKKANYGRIVNIASIWSIITRERRTAYAITKSGILGLTKTSAVELAPYNILVNAVSPGFTLTELTKATLSEQEYTSLSKIVPVGRFAQPVEIARIVLFLASDMNTYISGQNIIIDGGYTNV